MGWDAADKSSYGPNMGTLVENAQKGAYNWQKSDCLSGIRGACDPLFLSQPSCSTNSGYGGFLCHFFLQEVPGYAGMAAGGRVLSRGGIAAAGAEDAVAATAKMLGSAARRARDFVGEGQGPVYGTHVHTAFAAELKALGRPDLRSDVLNGRLADKWG